MKSCGHLFVALCMCFGYLVSAAGWHGHKTRQYHGSCPAEDPITHECFELRSENTTCAVFHLKCTYLVEGVCRWHYTMVSVPCKIFKCQSLGCCKGWTRNEYDHCEASSSHEQDFNCENGGTKSKYHPYKCICKPWFTGERCEKAVCERPCLNGGRCEIFDGAPFCVCPSNFYSDSQCENVKCAHSCQNGGVCINDGVQGRCKCTENYVGDRCQYEQEFELCGSVNDATPCTDIAERQQCNKNVDCNEDDEKCCFDGCMTVCKNLTKTKCYNNGTAYFPGDSYEPVACRKCVCQVDGEFHCVNMTCPAKTCPDNHSPIYVKGHCCKVCPGEELTEVKGPEFKNCRKRPVFAYVNPDGYTADLPKLEDLVAMDYINRRLSVSFDRTSFAHSRSVESTSNLHYVTAYSECDMYGRRAECVFQVLVVDRYPPQFTSCPIEIYAIDDEVITWDDPVAWDNVGIYKMEVNGDEVRGKALKQGTYVVSYTVRDYDRNQAICSFMIRTYSRDGFVQNLYTGRKAVPVETIVGCSIAILIVTVLLVFIFKRLKNQDQGSSTASQTEQAMNNIFMMSDNPSHDYENDVKLPAYSPPANPPPYEEIDPPTTDLGVVNPEPPVYEEIPERNPEPHYENTSTGYENPAYVNDHVTEDGRNMEYLKT